MKICFATSECVPYVKTGGLGDVAGALPKALSEKGHEVKLFMPFYGSIDPQKHNLVSIAEIKSVPVQIGGKTVTFDCWYGKLPHSEVEVYLIDCPAYFARPQLYTDDPDEDERFILFQHATFKIMQYYHWAPDVIHCNDWQTGLMPALLKFNYNPDHLFDNTVSLFSIHNIGYQGKFPGETVYKTGLPLEYYTPGGPFEFYNTFCFLKAGLMFADMISTVSETYAQEIQTPAYGAGLEGVLTARKAVLKGILNGIDNNDWHPQKDKLIPYPYSIKNIGNKKRNKQALLQLAKLPFDENTAVIGIVSRLAHQKGLDLIAPAIHEIMQLPVQIVLLGSGEKHLEEFFEKTAKRHKNKFYTYIGFNNELAHLITAGSDMFLMPSLYEPCGLNQMYSLNYGTVPIVRKTGGLADTVKDVHEYYGEGNGFSFNDTTPHALVLTIERAVDLFKNKRKWQEIMKRGMNEDFSWEKSAGKYIGLYEQMIKATNG